jgi:hypothetical protein
MVSLTSSSFLGEPLQEKGGPEDAASLSAAKMSELNEITNFIMLSQVLARKSLGDKLGLPILSKASDLSAVMQIEGCLDQLETSHASLLFLGTSQAKPGSDCLHRQRFLFSIRLVHLSRLNFMVSSPVLCDMFPTWSISTV